MSELAINGARVVTGSVTIPRRGMFTADVSMADAANLTGPVVLTMGKLRLKGAAFRQAAFGGARSARLVGGTAGWRKTIKYRSYSHEAGVRLSSVIGDAARDAGERVVIASDKVVGTFYVRERAKAERVLHALTDGEWFVDADGVTQVGVTRSSAPITSAFTVVTWLGGRGRFEIATDHLEDWTPGRTFTAPTVTGPQTINTVQISADNDGKVRVIVLTETSSAENRILDEVRAIIRAELPSLTYCAFWEYKIVGVSGTKVDVVPLNPGGIMPPISAVPPMPGLLGETVTPTVGKTCIVAFLNGSPTQPRWISADGNALSVAVDASLEVKLGAGVKPVACAGDFAGPFPIIPTQIKVKA